MSVYVAAPLSQVVRAKAFADNLRQHGLTVVSTWHDEVPDGTCDPKDPAERHRICQSLLSDLSRTEMMVALMDQGVGKGSFIEIGYALSNCLPTVWLQGPNGEGASVFDAHSEVAVVTTEYYAQQAVIEAYCE